MKRRLTTLVAADIAGWSRLVGLDEEGAVAAQRAHREALVDPLLSKHHGRVANTAGDSLLIEFPSAVEAVRCAIAVQEGMAERNSEIPEDRRIVYRVGVNVGDVLEGEDGDLLGDGVNVAARLEALAPPGGIVIGRAARDAVRDRLDLDFADLGEVEVKNIARPVRAFQVLREGETAVAVAPRRRSRLRLAVVAGMLLFAVAAAAFWRIGPYSDDATPRLSGPRVAVLPFDNFGPPDQEWFADGLTEDIITLLSLFNDLQVIARNSTFRFKGMPVDVREVGRDLGADYVLEGSVRRDGDTLRVTAQLLDAEDGAHLWADTYDRPLTADGYFRVQDELAGNVAAEIGGTAGAIATDRIEKLRTEIEGDLSGYECLMLVRRALFYFDAELHARTRGCLEAEVADHPRFADGWAGLAHLAIAEVTTGMNARPDSLERLVRSATRAAELAPERQFALSSLAVANFFDGKPEEAIGAAERAIAANPNDADTLGTMALYLVHLGEFDRAKALIDRALRLDAYPPDWFHYTLFHWHFARDDPEGALAALKRIEKDTNFVWQYLFTAVALVELDRLEDARAMIGRAERMDPGFRRTAPIVPALWWRYFPESREAYVSNLRAVGVELEPS